MATTIPDIFEHDIGTHFVGEVNNLVNSETAAIMPLSSATSKIIIFKKPDGTETEFPAAFVTDGDDGLLEYVTENNTDLVMTDPDTEFEQWQYYFWVQYPGGERRTSSVKFRLYKGRVSQAV